MKNSILKEYKVHLDSTTDVEFLKVATDDFKEFCSVNNLFIKTNWGINLKNIRENNFLLSKNVIEFKTRSKWSVKQFKDLILEPLIISFIDQTIGKNTAHFVCP